MKWSEEVEQYNHTRETDQRPETKFYDGDKSVCKISVAVDRSFKDKDGKPVTDF